MEALVGALDLERMTGQLSSSAELNDQVRFALSKDRCSAVPTRELTDEELARVREVRADLFARWWSVEPGSTLELQFERG